MTTTTSPETDRKHMARALKLARRGLYSTDPNPTVGCVVVADGQIVGEGWTAPVGGPHAERAALEAAGERARGATVYVTLEPCSHVGRTGPCADALVAAGVARVVCAARDPNPLVGGAGIERLRRAGIAVETGLLAAQAQDLNRGHVSRMTRRRPWVRVKVAASLDGRTALANGASRWITGEAARRDVHRWRARSSVVLTGIGTILADDPALNARLETARDELVQPTRVILDSRLRTPPAAKTLQVPGHVEIFAGAGAPVDRREALEAAGARVETVGAAPHCDLDAVLRRLAEHEHNEVWVEAGPRLSGAFVAAGFADELVVYLAPQLLGDRALGMFDLGVLTSLEQRCALTIDDVRRVGADLRIVARPSTVANP